MRDIFKAEWLRYRLWVLAFAVVHLLLLAFFNRLTDLGQQPLNVYRAFAGAYSAIGALLGLHQMGTWRRPNQWINLLHRPVGPRRIALGLLAAGAAAMALAVLLPVLALLAWQAWGTTRVAETRHVLLAAAAFLVAICGYLTGAYAMLADRRHAGAGLVLIAWIAVAQASGAGAVLIQGIACAWLLIMVLIAFRPDLGESPRSPVAMAFTAITVQVGVYLLLVLAGFVGELGWIMQGTHPANMSHPPAGGHVETDRLSPRDRMLAGLAQASGTEVPLWREQVALSEVYPLERQRRAVPERGDLGNAAAVEFDDRVRRVHWTFNHERMRFEGVSLADGTRRGERGIGAKDDAFPAVATPGGPLPGMGKDDVTLIAGNSLYQYRAATGDIVPRILLPQREWILGSTPVGGSLALLGDRAVYVFDARHLGDGDAPVHARYRIPMPGKAGDLADVDMVELVDGYLVSFTFTWRAYDMRGATPYQTVLWVNDAGAVVPVATRTLHQDFPAFYRYRKWWASPVMYTLCTRAKHLFSAPDPLEAYATPPIPDDIRALAAALALVVACVGAWIAWRRVHGLSSRIAWTLACAIVGLPALVSLMLLVPRREAFVGDSANTRPVT